MEKMFEKIISEGKNSGKSIEEINTELKAAGANFHLNPDGGVAGWTDYGVSGEGIIGVEMPKKYVAEMFCDRLAASKVYRGQDFQPGDPYQFFQYGKKKRLLMHPATSELLETILIVLRDQGEDAAFDYVRREVLGKK